MTEEKTPYDWQATPRDILMQSTWDEVRRRLDDLGGVIHRAEDAETRLNFIKLVAAIQQYEDMKKT